MTNGEKMQEIYPDIEMWGDSKDTLDYSLGGMIHRVTKSWWNAEYIDSTTKIDCDNTDCNNCVNHKYCDYEPTTKSETLVSLDVYNQVAKERDIAIQQLHELGYEFGQKIEPTNKNDLALIHTEGLDEEIRCTMCTNYMKSDRGCDGNCVVNKDMYKAVMDAIEKRIQPTTKNDLGVREFEGIEVTYPPEDICTYPEYKGKPYFAIQYRENGESFVGYGTYSPEVLSRYLKDYFMQTTKIGLGVDYISRQEVLRLLANSIGKSNIYLQTQVLRMPSVTPQKPRWIPVSEKLPENKETVLVTFKHFVSGNTIGLGSVILLRGKPHWHVREQNLGTYDVLAWMPLPTSYQGEKNE